MRILHTADWHLGRTLEGRSRLEEQSAFLDELADVVSEEQIDLILLAGDVYDTVNPPAAAERLFYDSAARLCEGGKRQLAVIAGNHDQPERISAAWPLAARHGIHLIGQPTAELLEIKVGRTQETALLYALPYPSESRLGELLSGDVDEASLRSAYSVRVGELLKRQAADFRPDTVNLIMSHLYVMGGAESDSERPIQVGGAYTVDTAALCAGAHYVALGHLHRPQNIKAPDGEIIRYSGSPLAYSFSEAGQAKSVTVLDAVPGRVPAMKELFLSSGRPLVRWRANGGLDQVHQWLDEDRDKTAWIDLELHIGDSLSMEQIQTLRRRHGGIVHIRPVYPEMAAEAAREAASSLPADEMFRRFYRKQTGGAEAEPELVTLFMELLEASREDGQTTAEGGEAE